MNNCLFCKIISGEIPSIKIYEDEHWFAFKDIEPCAPVHIGEDGFRLVVNTGEKAGQSVFHFHAHIIGGKEMGWPPFPEEKQ